MHDEQSFRKFFPKALNDAFRRHGHEIVIHADDAGVSVDCVDFPSPDVLGQIMLETMAEVIERCGGE